MSTRLGIIGGYLGSGKSTLVNRVLTGGVLGRAAVVVNDFGSVNIDADLIASADGDTLELTNGCICCQATDDTARVMTDLAARDDLDHVLCEVSGVGDPGQLAAWRSFPGFLPGPVLVCADATTIADLLQDEYVGDTVARQLASAEVVLVTKTDLCGPDACNEAVAACRDAAVTGEVLLQSRTHPGASAMEALTTSPPRPAAAATRGHDPHTETHRSRTLTGPDPIDVLALRDVLVERSAQLVRAKGLIRGHGGTGHEIQLAGGRVEVRRHALPGTAEASSTIVLVAAGPHAEEDLEDVRSALLPLFADRRTPG